MLFNSLQFAIFLPIVFALYWIVPGKYRWAVLLASSYYFYMSWNAKYVVLILFTTLVSFFSALIMEKTDRVKQRKLILTATLVLCLGVLFVFKYLNFFFDTVNAAFAAFALPLRASHLELLLPVGISFYTFQTLSYVIDVYKGEKAEKDLGIYATFVSYFPQLVAGPIERTSNLLPQLKTVHTFDYSQATYGVKLMMWGLAKKMVVADNLAIYVDSVYNNIHDFKGFSLVIAAVFFTIQIYCDFSGYSDIARGVSKMLGIELMENFRAPYFSSSIREFWSKWHISLSTWFRDYLYIPLGGNRVGKLRGYINLMITFLVSGLWHGANWTFIIWGAIHGIAQVIEKMLNIRKIDRKYSARWFARVALLFVFSTLAWVFFRAQSFSDAIYVISNFTAGITDPVRYLRGGLHAVRIYELKTCFRLFACIAPLVIFDLCSVKSDPIKWIEGKKTWVRYVFYFGIVLYILLFHAVNEVEFVYFQF